jgi:pimeloyl-ACP methyl ester carboxylesterase
VGSYADEQLAADAIALLEALRVPAALVVGHSLGSFVAQRLAEAAPQRVRGLVLVGSAATANNEIMESMVPIVQALTDPVDEKFVREFQIGTIYRPVPPDFLDRVVAEGLKLPAMVWKAVLAGLLDMPTAPAGLKLITCPVSIFWGDRDAIFGRSDQDELMRLIPQARLQVFTEVGHALHWEAPDEFVKQLSRVIP